MPTLKLDEFTVETDDEGYLLDHHAWTLNLAQALGQREGVPLLTDRHLQVIHYLRKVFAVRGETPNVYQVSQESGVGTQELYALFPGAPVKKAARIAGVKKPTSCV